MRTLLSGPSAVTVTNAAGGKTLIELLNVGALEPNLTYLAVIPTNSAAPINWASGNASNTSATVPPGGIAFPIQPAEANLLKFHADTNSGMTVMQLGRQ
jgi:hypothetical protein